MEKITVLTNVGQDNLLTLDGVDDETIEEAVSVFGKEA